MRLRSTVVLALVLALAVVFGALALGSPTSAFAPQPGPTKTHGPGNGCREGQPGNGNGKCPTPSPSPSPTASPSPTPTPPLETSAEVGFAKAEITPVGEPDPAWAPYLTPHPVTGVWGESYVDRNGNGCYDGARFTDVPAPDDPNVEGGAEPHVDNVANHAGDAYEAGFAEVDGVTIYGDPQSAGKWDGVWANAGFGSKCTLGAHDPTWARAAVIEVGDDTVALVSLDVVGLFNVEVQRMRHELETRYPGLEIDQLVVSSTHTHEGVDTMGYWGQTLGIDGKYPAYNAFIRSQVIDAVNLAYERREPAVAKFAQTEFTLGIRDSRPPHVIDPYLLAAQFVRPGDGSTIGTIVNWSNHPEAQGSNNKYVSSDFPHGTREEMERRYGGISVYFSGSVGGLMTPLGVDIPGFGSQVSWERTYEIGRLVAEAASAALDAAPLQGLNELHHKRRDFYVQADNTALNGLNAAGVFDIPTYVGADTWGIDGHTKGLYAGRSGPQFKTEMVAVQVGPALFLTVPGELFPEIEIGGYGRPDCAAADTGRPYEPVIGKQFDSEYQFILGLGQDELGYIVPGYDFWLRHVDDREGNDGNHEGVIALGALEEEDPCGEGHYEETVSASSVLAPWVACVAAELSGRDPWSLAGEDAGYAACSHENTHINPYGVNPDAVVPPGGPGSRFSHPPGYYDDLDAGELQGHTHGPHTHAHPHSHSH